MTACLSARTVRQFVAGCAVAAIAVAGGAPAASARGGSGLLPTLPQPTVDRPGPVGGPGGVFPPAVPTQDNPMLVSGAAVPGDGWIRYVFDQAIASADPGGFGFVTASGTEARLAGGSAVVSGQTVTVSVPAAASIGHPAAFFVLRGAATNIDGYGSPEAAVGARPPSRPQVTAVAHSPSGPNFFDVTFDHPVSPGVASHVGLYSSDAPAPGAPVALGLRMLQLSPTTVEVDFGAPFTASRSAAVTYIGVTAESDDFYGAGVLQATGESTLANVPSGAFIFPEPVVTPHHVPFGL